MKASLPLFLLGLTVSCWQAEAQIYETNNVVVGTFAGSGVPGYWEGQRLQAKFKTPSAVSADSSGNLFVLDSGNARIRKIAPDGTVSTFAGGGFDPIPGYGTNVVLDSLGAFTIDRSNTLWTIGYYVGTPRLVRIGSDGFVSLDVFTVFPFSWDTPYGICADSAGNIYVSTWAMQQIHRYNKATGKVEAFAGSGDKGTADGNGRFATFTDPTALAVDAADNIYVWDSGSHSIRRISQDREVVTIHHGRLAGSSDGVGTNAAISGISASGMCVDHYGNVLLACKSSIRKITVSGSVTTLAGSFGQIGFSDGAGDLARFNNASGVCVSQGVIYVADSGNHCIRQITRDPEPEPVSPANLRLSTYAGLQITGLIGRIYQIESSTDMTAWKPETNLLLTSTPYLWFDLSPLAGKKFYRAFLKP